MKVVLLIVFAAILSACGPSRMECMGDASVRCRNAAVDRALAKFDRMVATEVVPKKEGLVLEIGEAKYELLIELLDEYRDALDDVRPNWFLRVFASDMQIEPLPSPSFKRSRELDQLMSVKPSHKAAGATPGEKCLEAKMVAFRNEAGADAPIKFDIVQEWRSECGLPKEE